MTKRLMSNRTPLEKLEMMTTGELVSKIVELEIRLQQLDESFRPSKTRTFHSIIEFAERIWDLEDRIGKARQALK